MTLQHLTGTGTTAPFEAFAPLVDLMVGEDVVLEATEISFCLIELPVADVLRVLPSALHPSIPGMAGFMHYSVPGGPWGKFDMVLVGVLSRSGIKSRLMVTAAFIDNDDALDGLSRTWGFALRKAAIKLAVNYDRVRSTVSLDDRLLLDFEVEHPISLTGAGGSVRYPQPFNIGRRGNAVEFIQVDASYGFERVARGKPRITHCDPALLGGLNAEHCFPVTGTLAKTKMTLHPLRFTASTTTTAENGGVLEIT
jgi:hypothetical protein